MVKVDEASGHTLRGLAVARTTLAAHAMHGGDERIDAAILAAQLEAALANRVGHEIASGRDKEEFDMATRPGVGGFLSTEGGRTFV